MRILLVGDYPPDARLGSTKVLVKLQEEFRGLGHTCDLLLADGLGDWPRNTYLRRALGPVAALAAVRRIVRERGRYDVIDIASAEGIWVGALRRLGALPGTAVISRSNGLEHLNYRRLLGDHDAGLLRKPWTRRVFHPLARLSQVAGAARLADRLILLNDLDREFALGRGWKPADRIDLVPHGVSSSFLDSAPPPGAPRGRGILFCSTWAEMKGISYLVAAYSRLVADGSPPRLTVLGGGVPEERIRLAFAPETRALVTIVDRIDEAGVMEAYRTHDLMVLPSTYEGFGMVVVEAMSQRLPVVATPVGCARTLIEDGKTGLLVPLRDAAALAAAMARLLGDAPLRARVAEAAFAQVRHMTWTDTARLTLEVYARALSEGSARG